MRIYKPMISRFSLIVIILLLFSISFFPPPIQEKYRHITMGFLSIAFVVLFIKKRFAIFKSNDLFLWVFFITIGINVLFARQKDIAFRTYTDLVIPMFLIYYLVSESFSLDLNFSCLANAICVSSILVAVGALFESLFAINPIYKYFIENPFYERYITGFVRPMSTQFNPGPLGSYLLGCLPFNFLLFKQEKSFYRLVGAFGIVVNTVVIILTFSRGAFLGLITIVLFYLIVQKMYRSLIIFSIALSIFLFLSYFLPYPFSRFGINWIVGKAGILSTYRLERKIMTLSIIRDHPFIGLGFQHFRLRFYEYYPGKYKIPYETMIADNMYLTLLAETGTIGFLGFLIFMVSLFKRAWKQMAILTYASKKRWQLFIILMAFIGLLVNMGGYEFFYWPNPYLFFCILVGSIEASCRMKK